MKSMAVSEFNDLEHLRDSIVSKAKTYNIPSIHGKAVGAFDVRNVERMRELHRNLVCGLNILGWLYATESEEKPIAHVFKMATALTRGDSQEAREIMRMNYKELSEYVELTALLLPLHWSHIAVD